MNRRHLIKTTIGAAAATVLPLPTPDGLFAAITVPVRDSVMRSAAIHIPCSKEGFQAIVKKAEQFATTRGLVVRTSFRESETNIFDLSEQIPSDPYAQVVFTQLPLGCEAPPNVLLYSLKPTPEFEDVHLSTPTP